MYEHTNLTPWMGKTALITSASLYKEQNALFGCLTTVTVREMSANQSNEREKKEKDTVGQQNLDVPMLDTFFSEGNRVFCDIIICTKSGSVWEAVIQARFESYLQDCKQIHGGKQVTFTNRNSNTSFVTVNFYASTRKLTIQTRSL